MGLAMLHPSQPAAPPADHIAAYFARVDAQLAATVDNGARAVLLNGQIDRWENLMQRLLAWSQDLHRGPNPVGPNATAWDVNETINGLCIRLARVEQAARDQIAEAAL
jgi:hypothetical protein